ncbi:hypothetical protein [Anaeromassilibacillus sp. An200]|uniref:hypothetical protein n=1 Tax=Anaeromassilibacillus sp. An200 TaxID=1965587 RepID=UPI000B36B45F|nr:hypothetical protein [Anaeromassilibacillus sp. An200]OUP07866.1 hypothetical protein B5F35_14010 [Anaeromassilibacillus sp. An200]
MGFRLQIDGAGPVKLTERAITKVTFGSEIPEDSNARATDNGASIRIWGKLLFSLGGEEQDSTLNLAQWSLVPSESADSYRTVQVDVVSASQIVRRVTLPNAFVVEYSEALDDESGVGSFYLHVKQKKDQTDKVTIDGEFSA